jgi:hypothetical protein
MLRTATPPSSAVNIRTSKTVTCWLPIANVPFKQTSIRRSALGKPRKRYVSVSSQLSASIPNRA